MPDLQLVYADEALLVWNKPAGLLSVPGRGADKQDCLSRRATERYPDALVVHRLDMATSGLLLMARGVAAQRSLNHAFAQRQVHKRYEAVVHGVLGRASADWQQIELPIAADWPNRPLRVIDAVRGKPSLTRWQLLASDAKSQTTRLLLEPVTGRSHQLRVHLQAIGHPIVGDGLYGPPLETSSTQRLLLHASQLELSHPTTGQALRFDSPAPF